MVRSSVYCPQTKGTGGGFLLVVVLRESDGGSPSYGCFERLKSGGCARNFPYVLQVVAMATGKCIINTVRSKRLRKVQGGHRTVQKERKGTRKAWRTSTVQNTVKVAWYTEAKCDIHNTPPRFKDHCMAILVLFDLTCLLLTSSFFIVPES